MYEDRAEIISRHYGVPLPEVQKVLDIGTREAIGLYLSEESRAELQRRGINPSGTDTGSKLSMALLPMTHLPGFREDFCQTREGAQWYEYHVNVQNALAGGMVTDPYETFFTSPSAKVSPARRVALEITARASYEARQFLLKRFGPLGSGRSPRRRGCRFRESV